MRRWERGLATRPHMIRVKNEVANTSYWLKGLLFFFLVKGIDVVLISESQKTWKFENDVVSAINIKDRYDPHA